MDRLTTRNPDGTVGIGHPLRYYNHEDIVQVLDRLAAYEDTGLEPETIIGLCEMDKRSRMAQMLRWEDAETEGRLVVLPCKVGDVVYVIKHRGISSGDILPMAAKWIETNAYGWCVCCEYPPLATFALKFEDFGKTVFLTREEAEQALKGE